MYLKSTSLAWISLRRACYRLFQLVCHQGTVIAHTQLSSIGFQSWSWFLAVSLQVTWVINVKTFNKTLNRCHIESAQMQHHSEQPCSCILLPVFHSDCVTPGQHSSACNRCMPIESYHCMGQQRLPVRNFVGPATDRVLTYRPSVAAAWPEPVEVQDTLAAAAGCRSKPDLAWTALWPETRHGVRQLLTCSELQAYRTTPEPLLLLLLWPLWLQSYDSSVWPHVGLGW